MPLVWGGCCFPNPLQLHTGPHLSQPLLCKKKPVCLKLNTQEAPSTWQYCQ